MKIKLYLVFALFTVLFLSCNKDKETVIVIDTIPVPEVKVFATINGLILDEEENPINQAKIVINSDNTYSDENGYFSISGNFNPTGTYIKITKEGFFEGNGLVIPHADDATQVKFILVKKEPTTGISSDEIIFETERATITFKPNSFIDQKKTKYTGPLSIYGHSIDLLGDNANYILPGTMQTEKEGERLTIQPFGIVNVELYGKEATLLQIDQTAQISIEIPESLQSVAPQELPLWYLDDADGLWKEEGKAVRNGTQYEGEVSHFTLWTVGLTSKFYTLSGTITRGGIPYPNVNINIKYPNASQHRFYTDNKGNYSFLARTSESFIIEVLDNCDGVIESRSMLGNMEDAVLDIEMEALERSRIISGTILDCNNNPLSNAYVLFYFEGKKYQVVLADQNGHYQALYEVCGEDQITARGYNRNNKQLSIPLYMEESIKYNIVICKSLSDPEWGVFFTTIDGDTYTINNCTVSTVDTAAIDLQELTRFAFEYIDTFPSYPSLAKETVSYNNIIYIDLSGAKTSLGASDQEKLSIIPIESKNPPIVYDFVLKHEQINLMNDEVLDISFGSSMSNLTDIRIKKNGSVTDTKGIVRIRARRK